MKKRKYVKELEAEYGVQLLTRYKDGKGRELDGVTEAQKQALRRRGVNTTGVKYKIDAIRVFDFLNGILIQKPKKNDFFRIKVIRSEGNIQSQRIFCTLSDAEYYAAQRVNPKYDVQINNFQVVNLYVVQGRGELLYYQNKGFAMNAARITKGNWQHFRMEVGE